MMGLFLYSIIHRHDCQETFMQLKHKLMHRNFITTWFKAVRLNLISVWIVLLHALIR